MRGVLGLGVKRRQRKRQRRLARQYGEVLETRALLSGLNVTTAWKPSRNNPPPTITLTCIEGDTEGDEVINDSTPTFDGIFEGVGPLINVTAFRGLKITISGAATAEATMDEFENRTINGFANPDYDDLANLAAGTVFRIHVELTTSTLANGANQLALGGEGPNPNNNPDPAFFTVTLDQTGPTVTDVVDVSPDPRNTDVSSVDVILSELVDLSEFTFADVSLTRNGSNVPLNGSVTVSRVTGTRYRINGLGNFTDAGGDYVLTVNASGLRDLAGNAGTGSASDTWENDQTAPGVTDVLDVQPDPRSTPVTSVDVILTEEVDLSEFTFADVSLGRNGGNVPLDNSVTVTQVSGNQYRINNLGPFTGSPGDYTLTVNGSGLRDLAGNAGTGSASDMWETTREALVVDNAGDVDDGDFGPGEFTLREAVNRANGQAGGDTIVFDPRLSNATITLTGTPLVFTDDVNLRGLGAMSLAIDGNAASAVLRFNGSIDAMVSHITVQNGNGASGGGIHNDGDLKLRHVRVVNNVESGDGGGGIFNDGTLTILDSEISGNSTTTFGGGLRDASPNGDVTIINTTISNNEAASDGGGIDHSGSNVLLIRNSTVTGNRTDSDGSATGTGGGIWIGNGDLELHNTAIIGNFNGTGTTPDDLFDSGDVLAGSSFNLIGDAGSAGGLTDGVNGNIVGNGGAGTRDVSTVLDTTLADNGGETRTHALVPGSVAINAGDDDEALDEMDNPLRDDQRGPGHDRTSGETDIGAFEVLVSAVADAAETTTGQDVDIPVLDNDTPENGTRATGITGQPANGTATIRNNDEIEYTPDPGFTGADPFTYEMGLKQVKLGPGETAPSTELGHSVAVDGDWMVVGGISDDNPNENGGTARIYRRTDDRWTLHQTIEAADEAATDRYGYDVAISGTTVVVSARMDDDSGFNSGSAYVWEYNAAADEWVNTAKLLDPQGQEKDQFGHSVDIDADTIIVGARLGDGQGTNSGTVVFFERTTSGWVFSTRIKADDASSGDQFGFGVAISGDTAIVTSRKDDDSGRDSGSAYILERNQGGANNWGQIIKILPGIGRVNDWFGQDVDIEGDTAAVGKPIRNGRNRAGEVHIFQRNQGGADNWGEVAVIQDSNPTPNQDQFAYSVSLSGDNLLAGSRRDDTGAGNAGSASLFNRNEGGNDNWGQTDFFLARDPDQGDNAGTSVAIDGNTAVFGAPADDESGGSAGAAYVEDLRRSTAVVTVQVGAPLRAAAPGAGGAESLTQAELDTVTDQALAFWQSSASTGQLAALEFVEVLVGSLTGDQIGLESGGRIVIDDDAAGHGWTVSGGSMDLLTTVVHELGHAIGHSDTYESAHAGTIMFGFLAPGEVRVSAETSSLDAIFGSLDTRLGNELDELFSL